jgi:hypothetical protein
MLNRYVTARIIKHICLHSVSQCKVFDQLIKSSVNEQLSAVVTLVIDAAIFVALSQRKERGGGVEAQHVTNASLSRDSSYNQACRQDLFPLYLHLLYEAFYRLIKWSPNKQQARGINCVVLVS